MSGGWSMGDSAPAVPSVIGEAFGGGYYAGQISTTGDGVATHYLIVAPKASGEIFGKKWSTTNAGMAGTPNGALGTGSNRIQGPEQTAWMVTTSGGNPDPLRFPAAQFCASLNIAGYTDWYMPALNELEVLYYNLKPIVLTNNPTYYTLVNINAVSPESNSVTAYTADVPTQTTSTLFRAGGSEAFESDFYWASTNSWYFGMDQCSYIKAFGDSTMVNSGNNTITRNGITVYGSNGQYKMVPAGTGDGAGYMGKLDKLYPFVYTRAVRRIPV